MGVSEEEERKEKEKMNIKEGGGEKVTKELKERRREGGQRANYAIIMITL